MRPRRLPSAVRLSADANSCKCPPAPKLMWLIDRKGSSARCQSQSHHAPYQRCSRIQAAFLSAARASICTRTTLAGFLIASFNRSTRRSTASMSACLQTCFAFAGSLAHAIAQPSSAHDRRGAQADWHSIGAPLHLLPCSDAGGGSVDCGNANNNVSPESTPTCDAGKSAPWPASCQVCRGSRCLDTHLQRARSLANKLRASKSFGTGMTTYPDGRIRSFGNGSRYVLVNTLWRNHEHTLGRELTSLLHHSWLPSVDPRFPRYGPQRRIARAPKPVTGPLLPYVASSLMDKCKTDEAMYLERFHAQRYDFRLVPR